MEAAPRAAACALSSVLIACSPPAKTHEPPPAAMHCANAPGARVEALVRQGRLDRARRYLQQSADVCGPWESSRKRALLEVLSELGDVEGFVALAEQLRAEGATGLPAPPQGVTRPREELQAAMSALHEGRSTEARRLLDRTRVAYLRKNMSESLVALQVRVVMGDNDDTVLVSADNRFFTSPSALSRRAEATSQHRTAALSAPYVRFGRSPWAPRHMLDDANEHVLGEPDQGEVLVDTAGPVRLVDDRGVTLLSEEEGSSPVATPHGIAFLERVRGHDRIRAVLFDREKGVRAAEQQDVPWAGRWPALRFTSSGFVRALEEGEGVAWLKVPSLDVVAVVHDASIGSSRDGAVIATVNNGGASPREVRVFDANAGRLLRTGEVSLRAGSISEVSVHPDGEVIAVVTQDWKSERTSIHVAHLTSGAAPLIAEGPESHAHVAPEFTANGRHLKWGPTKSAKVFDIDEWRVVPDVNTAALFPADGGGYGFHPWNDRDYGSHLRALASPRFAPDVAVGRTSVAWASARPGESFLNLWSAPHGWRLRLEQAHCHPAIGPHDETVAAVRNCDEKRNHDQVVVYRLDTGAKRSLHVPFRVAGLALSSRGAHVLAWGGEHVALFEPFGGGAVAWTSPAPIVRPALLSPDGTSVVQRWATHLELMWLPGSPTANSNPAPHELTVHSIPCPTGRPVHYVDAHTVRCGRHLIDLRHPRAVPTRAARRPPYPAVEGEVVTLFDASERVLARIYSDVTRGSFALLTTGVLDPMGDAHGSLFCRYNHNIVPLPVCADRWVEDGALARAWTAQP